jgi:hypothetical protein
MSCIRREDKENNLLFNVVFDEFERTMRLVAIKEKKVIFAI